MNVVPLSATTGRDTGKGANRRLRTEGKIPGTVYGLDAAPATITIDRSDFRRALTTPAGINALLELSYDGASQYALVKEIQRHPVRRDPIHVDLQRIDPEKPIALTVPIILKGEAKPETMPVMTDTSMLTSTRSGENSTGKPGATARMPRNRPKPTTMPPAPPMRQMETASMRNCSSLRLVSITCSVNAQ